MTDQPTTLSPADQAREYLTTIRRGWALVLDPIETTTTSAGASSQPRPATEDEVDEKLPPDARYDTPRTLAFWVHAAIDEWPTILQTLEPVDPTKPDGKLELRTTKSVDLSDVYALIDLLHQEAGRLATWVDDTHDFGATFVEDLELIAAAVKRVAWPPKGDRVTIGECPDCGRRVRVKAPRWLKRPVRVPNPTTDPQTYPAWDWWIPDDAPFEPERDRPITCRCSLEDTIEGWHGRLVDFEHREPKTADELVVIIHEQMGLRYQPLTIRTWQRRGIIQIADYAKTGHARYDVTQVLAALIDRDRRREAAS